MRPLLLFALLACPAFADQMGGASQAGYAVLTTATQVFTPSSANATSRSLKVINRGSDTIYCSPSSSVTTDTGDPVPSGQSVVYPAVPLYCITTVNQTLTGSERTLVWESAA